MSSACTCWARRAGSRSASTWSLTCSAMKRSPRIGPVMGSSSTSVSRPIGLLLPTQPDVDEVIRRQWSHVLEDLTPGPGLAERLHLGIKRLLLALVHQERGVEEHHIAEIIVYPCLDGQRLKRVQERSGLRLTLLLERGCDKLAQLDALVPGRLGWLAGQAIPQRADVVVLGHDVSKDPLLVPQDLELELDAPPHRREGTVQLVGSTVQ